MFRYNSNKLNTNIVLDNCPESKVYPYQKFPNDDKWAVKHIIIQSNDELPKIIQEIVLGFSCAHPSILPIKGFYLEPGQPVGWDVYIKIPRMQGNLADFLENRRKNRDFIPKEEIIKHFYTLACGLEYLHNKGIAHRDIRPKNILFDKKGRIKIGDIGTAKYIPKENRLNFTLLTTAKAGSMEYMAPELFEEQKDVTVRKRNFFMADSWSLGAVVAEMCTLKTPERNAAKLKENAKFYLNEYLQEKYNDNVLTNLVLDLVHKDLDQRKSIIQARKILEVNYSDILGLKEKNIDSQLSLIKQELTKTWQKGFKFDENKIFAIKAKNSSWIDDGKLSGFVQDLEKNMQASPVQNISHFEMDFKCCAHLTDKSIGTIAKYMGTSFKRLQNLALDFSGCHKITDGGLQTLTDSIGLNLDGLRHFSLDLGWCKNITDKGAASLKDCLAKLDNLQSLSLNLRSCSKITDNGVQDIAAGIARIHEKLESLSLNFWGCTEIKNEGILAINASIGDRFIKLHHYSLNFVGCYQITDEVLPDLTSHIQNSLWKLDYISLNFVGCDQIHIQGQNKMIQTLKKFIPQCDILFDAHK